VLLLYQGVINNLFPLSQVVKPGCAEFNRNLNDETGFSHEAEKALPFRATPFIVTIKKLERIPACCPCFLPSEAGCCRDTGAAGC